MKLALSVAVLFTSFSTLAAPDTRWLTIDNKVLKQIRPLLDARIQSLQQGKDSTVLKVAPEEVELISATIHTNLHRCGGFVAHDSLTEAQLAVNSQEFKSAREALFTDYSIDQHSLVSPMVEDVSETEIRLMIEKLSSFETRHYYTESGAQSSEMIYETWKDLTKHRSDVKVELFKHPRWPQSSIILTLEGSDKADEIVLLGGHADSITIDGGPAPGADDNASGIASITETLRILMAHDFKPRRTIQLMAYAAEEVGLLGSKEIARKYKKEKKAVIGVMQLDMTLYKGSQDKDIVLISDYTNKHQNVFLGNLINEYVQVPWGYSQCGYGCSDHASWSSLGYPASFPFEARMDEINHNIHTINDTLESAGGHAEHAVNFTKLGIAYLVELAN